ncbi:MAG: hypothetical protein WAM58_06380 [Candidatus Acidiferrum sp.]
MPKDDAEDQHAKREKLTKKRDELYERFLKTPGAIHLAFEIKALDDKISECTELLRRNREADK